MVKAETFRQDLFYRLRTFVIPLPPLRERRADIAAMALHFLDVYAEKHKHPVPGFTPEAIAVSVFSGAPLTIGAVAVLTVTPGFSSW